MFICKLDGIENTNQYEELMKVFLPPNEYKIIHSDDEQAEKVYTFKFDGDKNKLKRELFRSLSEYTDKNPKWGILTGIRPVKLTGEIYKKTGSIEETENILNREYMLHPLKSRLVTDILQYQRKIAGAPAKKSLSLYLGIPFCPTRCLYCSFTSNQKPKEEIDRYLKALLEEMEFAGKAAEADGFSLETVYIGGGTPTTLDENQLNVLLTKIEALFDLSHIREFTVEAGRPDTITEEKLKIMKKHGVDRISINPQTMKDETLSLIGRKHSVEDIKKAFNLAHREGIQIINADIIAGLPEESFEDFRNSLNEMLKLDAGNITLHTLAVKRAARLKEMDEAFNYKNEDLCEEMLSYALKKLKSSGYRPYYLYRQKHTSGNTENIGFCKDDTPSFYNIRIMEEAQSILALGAGGISKIYFPEENRLERVANVSNYEIYIDRLSEMKDRKKKRFFGQNI